MAFNKEQFRVLPEHLKLLASSDVRYVEHEFGAAGVDPKRPYGSSSVVSDIARVLDIAPDDENDGFSVNLTARLAALHRQTAIALQIFLHTARMEPGVYERERYVGRWYRVSN